MQDCQRSRRARNSKCPSRTSTDLSKHLASNRAKRRTRLVSSFATSATPGQVVSSLRLWPTPIQIKPCLSIDLVRISTVHAVFKTSPLVDVVFGTQAITRCRRCASPKSRPLGACCRRHLTGSFQHPMWQK